MAAILTVKALRVERSRTAILRGVDWAVGAGQHWAILGPNGCGKTSLLKALTGYLAPTSGSIEVLGQAYGESDWRDLRLKVGVVTSAFQASIPPAECALDTVISGKYAQLDLWKTTTPADRRAAARLLAFVGLGALREREWRVLSQGERQRVLIARSLMARPRLLILDEPCAGLDPVAREGFLAFVGGLTRSPGGPALVLVTHHVEEIVPGFTHALILRQGSVFRSGTTRAVITTATLSAAFGASVRVRRTAGRYRASVSSAGR